MISEILKAAKAARGEVARISDESRNALLLRLADEVLASSADILEANKADYDRMPADNPFRDRLLLTPERLAGIASDIRNVSLLPSPLGRILLDNTMPNGLRIKKVSVPFGVVGIVYEARPNVTLDVFSLCFKSGNVCVLKGGRDAECSNKAIVAIIKKVLSESGITGNAVNMLPSSHEAAAELLAAVGLVDVVIPRGGRRLIDFVRENSKVPCIETGAGVVNAYFDKAGDLEKGKAIITNAKTRRVSVCNALDCLIIHADRLDDLPCLCSELAEKNVFVHADERAREALEGNYPRELLLPLDDSSRGKEFLGYEMSVMTADSIEMALSIISEYGSGHSESIVTDDAEAAALFQAEVDAACVYVNAPTSFTDGAQFGLGAEIGISTQKLGARGPMGLEEICSYKWLVEGDGQVRPI